MIEITLTRSLYLRALESSDVFQGRNWQGVLFAETPCWSVLAMPVPCAHDWRGIDTGRMCALCLAREDWF